MLFSSETWGVPPPSSLDTCPCRRPYRLLQEEGDGGDDYELWEIIYTSLVLFFMFAILISDRVGADSVMLMALTAFIAAGIVSLEEGLAGFSNEGLLTVLTLFVVADGISKTGALDWYMGKILGRPKSAASAQLRLMVPVTLVSAFLNNTPVVAVMMPIVQKWAKNNNISVQQLLMHLSFASILGGTCTLIGTSTNLVVVGLLNERYPNDPDVNVELFDLGLYGVPVALAGIAYMILASPYLLPGGKRRSTAGQGDILLDSQEDILLAARLAPWSPAAGRSVKRSGLRDTGGIYLVSVYRAATGNVHRAVGQEFVLNVGDILYFTGLIEGFGEFCDEHGLEILTNDSVEHDELTVKLLVSASNDDDEEKEPTKLEIVSNNLPSLDKREDRNGNNDVPVEIGVTVESLLNSNDTERSRAITRMIDLIRGYQRDEPIGDERLLASHENSAHPTTTHRVVVMNDHDLVVIGVEARDRPGLMMDISKALSRLHLNLRHTEATVVRGRSISVWRCELVESELPDLEHIWSVLNALLEVESGSYAIKERGLRVLRACITKTSSLIGKSPNEVDFRRTFRAGLVAIQQGGRNAIISTVTFGPGDILVLQVSDNSPLLQSPPPDFYKQLTEQKEGGTVSRTSSLVNILSKGLSVRGTENLQSVDTRRQSTDFEEENSTSTKIKEINNDLDGIERGMSGAYPNKQSGSVRNETTRWSKDDMLDKEVAWKDLQVISLNSGQTMADGSGSGAREFLTAMEVAPKSSLATKTVSDIGLDKLPGVFLVSIDRPANKSRRGDALKNNKVNITVVNSPSKREKSDKGADDRSDLASLSSIGPVFTAISTDEPLQEGDVLWFAGSASAVGDLRKIPGLLSYERDEVEKMNEKVHDRRLVEAVIGRRGPLVGKTVKEIRFRTKFGAAVIAVHRDGKRIHDHPGNIKLQAGDVLLLEAGPTFIKKSVDNNRSFALLAEVDDSAPPRLRLLFPALFLTVAMLAVYTAGVASLLVCALVASILMVCIGILSEQEARDAINWDIYIAIASAFGIGTALVNSGVAAGIANFLVDIGEAVGLGDAGLIGAVYLGTFLISLVVTNNAAAALMFPIALDAAEKTGTDRVIMCYTLMLGASASFASPFGYQTNLMVYGPGGYKTKDFISIGTPLQLVLWILSVLILAGKPENWWISWAGTFVALVLVVSTQVANPFALLKQHPKDS